MIIDALYGSQFEISRAKIGFRVLYSPIYESKNCLLKISEFFNSISKEQTLAIS